MFSIGEFARHGRVSVRMLRHYGAIGLIGPACVDAATGYRFYQASQLDELNRVIALKDLGFTLQQVQAILEEKLSAAELRGMLRLRRAEIQATIDAETDEEPVLVERLLDLPAPLEDRADSRHVVGPLGQHVGDLHGSLPGGCTPCRTLPEPERSRAKHLAEIVVETEGRSPEDSALFVIAELERLGIIPPVLEEAVA